MTITEQRMAAVRHVLADVPGRVTIDAIAQLMRDNGDDDLIRVVSPSQTLGAVLRQMERNGEVDRVMRGYHKWGLR